MSDHGLTPDILNDLIERIQGIKKVRDDGTLPSYEEVAQSEPDLAAEFAAIKEFYDKYVEFPPTLIYRENTHLSPVRLSLANSVLSQNGLLKQTYTVYLNGSIRPERWKKPSDIPNPLDGVDIDEAKGEMLIFMRRHDAPPAQVVEDFTQNENAKNN